jgi:hypothetical protein
MGAARNSGNRGTIPYAPALHWGRAGVKETASLGEKGDMILNREKEKKSLRFRSCRNLRQHLYPAFDHAVFLRDRKRLFVDRGKRYRVVIVADVVFAPDREGLSFEAYRDMVGFYPGKACRDTEFVADPADLRLRVVSRR